MSNNPSKWRIGFFGSADFSVFALKALLDNNIRPVLIYSQPPKARGRGMTVKHTVVGELAEQYQIPLRTPEKFEQTCVEHIGENSLDLLIVVAYGLILPREILSTPRLGCINIHPSLLPRWRGAAPLQRSIQAGDKKSGVSIIQMDSGIDTGDILWQEKLDIPSDYTAGDWHDHTGKIGVKGLLEILPNLEKIFPKPQANTHTSYAKMIQREELQIDFHQSAEQIKNHIRAFSPKPGAWCTWKNKRLRLFSAKILRHDDEQSYRIGEVCDNLLTIRTASGFFTPQEIQLEGKQRMKTLDFLRGHPIPNGTILQGRSNTK